MFNTKETTKNILESLPKIKEVAIEVAKCLLLISLSPIAFIGFKTFELLTTDPDELWGIEKTPTLDEEAKEHHKIMRSQLAYITKKNVPSDFIISDQIEDLLCEHTDVRHDLKRVEQDLSKKVI